MVMHAWEIDFKGETGWSDMYYLEVGSIRFTDTVEQELDGLKFCTAWSWSYGRRHIQKILTL